MMRVKHENGTHVRHGALALAFATLAAGSLAVVPSRAAADDYAVAPAETYVLHGTVASSTPYRVLLGQRERTVAVDLKHGTIIQPIGTSITAGMHLAIRGYWSKGVFIANQVVLDA